MKAAFFILSFRRTHDAHLPPPPFISFTQFLNLNSHTNPVGFYRWNHTRRRMSGDVVRKAWVVAATIGSVEALKDQGVALWNKPLMKISYYSSTVVTTRKFRVRRGKEESMKKAMDMSCFGSNNVRF
ncbi:unnamed protein product [Lactuca virosa]|uniref:Uncharacterized protein n=1 Tax=Lactuca virosa TaxID=75947 RepID=A0AAU9P339_9ASTR|nr:unnamed protein product [Lactuca virosa]